MHDLRYRPRSKARGQLAVVFMCGECGQSAVDAKSFFAHLANHVLEQRTQDERVAAILSPIEQEALLAIEERVKHSPDYKTYYQDP